MTQRDLRALKVGAHTKLGTDSATQVVAESGKYFGREEISDKSAINKRAVSLLTVRRRCLKINLRQPRLR